MEKIVDRVIGSIIADDGSPSFDVFRFKANANEYVYPGTLVGTLIEEKKFLIGRIASSLEVNPHESPERAKVREAMDIKADYPEEEFSTNIYRVYEADVIEEGSIEEDKLIITQPLGMAKAGGEVFVPTEEIIAEAMGFEKDAEKSLCLGKTQIANNQNTKNNVLLKPSIIQRHIFVGGTTGSGKSYGSSIILEEVNKLGLPIIIFDSQNEYHALAAGLGGQVLVPGEDYEVRLSSLTESETQQSVPSLKEGSLGYDLLGFSFLRLRKEKPEGFGLNELIAGMEEDAPKLELKPISYQPAIRRTRTSFERHKFIGSGTDWETLLSENPVINVDCADLDQSQLQLIVGATLRELQRLRLAKKIPPYLVVLDEAHLLVPEGEDSPCKQVIRENVRIGRHYGICMMLITQSPVDIDKKTIRQCNTRFIFSLEPDQLDSIRGVRSDATEEMLNRLPKMPRGTCVLSGTYETIRHAIPIKIRSDRKTPPGGETPDIFAEIAPLKEKWQKKT